MKVFLSWSGPTSREVASVLRDWLPFVVQAARPFLSVGDIDKGQRWSDVLANELNTSAYGIICLTPYNFRQPWINFEAGAISKALAASSVSPFLFGVQPAQLEGPLEQFQSTVYRKDDVLKLVQSINNRQEPEDRVAQEILELEFEKWWPDLQDKLDKIEVARRSETETGFTWLYTRDDLIRMEAQDVCESIWIITPNVYNQSLAPAVKDIVRQNLERGVQYTFITPPSEDLIMVQRALQPEVSTRPGKVQIQEVGEDEFRRLAATDYIIVNPDDDQHRHAFVELPIEIRGYWIEVEAKAAMNFAARFRDLASRTAPAPPARP